jgi:thiol-disulfide isomerase/thioredoxin
MYRPAFLSWLILAAALPAQTLENVRLGEPLLGGKPELDDLKGKVVVVEKWGVHCAPCMKSLPYVARLYDELGDFGLVVVGLHVQDVPADEVKTKALQLGVKFPVMQGGDVEGGKKEGIPMLFLFGPDGKVAFEGSPMEAEAAIRSELGKALIRGAGISEPHAALKPVVEDLTRGKNPALSLARLNGLARAANNEVKTQASALAATIEAVGRKRLEDARERQKDDPVGSYDTAMRLVTAFKGSSIATQANELAGRLRSDKAVVAELRARPILEQVRRLDLALAAGLKQTEEVTPEFKKAYAEELKKLSSLVGQLKKNFPDAAATRDAVQIADKYQVK